MPKMTKAMVEEMVKSIVGETTEGIRNEIASAQQKHQEQYQQLLAERRESEQPKKKGNNAGGFLRVWAAAKGSPERALSIAKQWKMEGVVKALEEQTLSAGGALVPEDMMEDVIDLLRPASVVRRSGAVSVPMPNGNLTMPYVDTGVTAQYIGESRCVPKDEPTFGQLVLQAKKLAVLVPISNDLLRDAMPQANEIVRNDMVQAASVREDLAFLRGDGTQFTPRGLTNWAGNTNAQSGTTLQAITDDLGQAIFELENDNIPLVNGNWFFSPRTKKELMTIRDGNGNLVWAEEMARGSLMGFPYHISTQIPNNLGGGSNESEVIFADMSSVVIGENLSVSIDVSDSAAYEENSSVKSSFCYDQTVVRLIARHDFGCRQRGNEVATITGVTWGA